jgi:hypothetical protein
MRIKRSIVIASLALAVGGWAAQSQAGTSGAVLHQLFRDRGMTLDDPPDQPVGMMNQSEVYGGQSVSGARGGGVFVQSGGHPCRYAIGFDQPKSQITFNRSYLIAGPSGITHPVWTATAYDAAGRQLSQVGEDEIRSYQDVPARNFTLTGPDISRVVFWGDDRGFDAFCNVVIDTINLYSP